MTRFFVIGAVVIASVIAVGCNNRSQPASNDAEPGFAFITNGVADFWEHAEAGAQAAGKELGAGVTVIMPSSITDQTRKIEDLLTRGTDGIAISPIDPANQVEIINRAAA